MPEKIIKASPDHFLTDGKTTHYFPTERDRKIAQYFLLKGATYLYALAVDYPGLYKIPLCYRKGAMEAVKTLGIKTTRPKYYRDARPFAQFYFLGPKRKPSTFGVSSKDATSFKIWFCNFEKFVDEELSKFA